LHTEPSPEEAMRPNYHTLDRKGYNQKSWTRG